MTPRILFATTADTGHFSPLIPYADACRRAGHEVLVVGQAAAAPLAQRAGLPFRPVHESGDEELAEFRKGQEGLSQMQAMARALTDLYIRLYAGDALDEMIAAIDEWRPDVVVRESAEFSSLVAAEHLGVPTVEIGIGLAMQMGGELLPLAGPPLDELGARLGLGGGLADRLAASPCLTMSPPSLEAPNAPQRDHLRRFRDAGERGVGSLRLEWDDPSLPLVYMSFGTAVPSKARGYFPALYREALDALSELPVRILVTIGDKRDPAELGPLARSVRVERWVPQAAALAEATVMIGHGGAGSTLGALAVGVPMALLPLFADQPINAQRVAELGAGITLDGGADSVAELGPAVQELLTDERYHQSARRLAAEIRALPSIDEAAEFLADIAEDGERVTAIGAHQAQL